MAHDLFIRESIRLAYEARENGNHPFGSLLVDAQGHVLLEAENTVVTGPDCTGHAETNLMRQASKVYAADFLAQCTLYTSTEPCPMCAGAIFWGNVRRVVYGLSQEGFYSLIDEATEAASAKTSEETLQLPCREVFGRGRKPIEVTGPLLEEEAREVHLGFWV